VGAKYSIDRHLVEHLGRQLWSSCTRGRERVGAPAPMLAADQKKWTLCG